MNESALVDTGFWIALFDRRDERHAEAGSKAVLLEDVKLLFPWPVVYETLRTRFVRRPDWVARLDDMLKQPGTELIDDRDYREEAYSLLLDYSLVSKRPISMVDVLCRLLIADPNIKLDYLFTTNPADFADVCHARDVHIV